MSQEQNEKSSWTEIISVTGEELLSTVKGLLNEVGVRRIVVRKKDGKKLADIPLYLGMAGLVIFRFWALVPIAAGFLADYTVEVTREGKASQSDPVAPPPATNDKQPATNNKQPATNNQPPAPDDLTKISGIGPKLSGYLNENGITTFAQIAATSVDDLQALLDKAGTRYRIIDPSTWPEQAQQLMN